VRGHTSCCPARLTWPRNACRPQSSPGAWSEAGASTAPDFSSIRFWVIGVCVCVCVCVCRQGEMDRQGAKEAGGESWSVF
jgi:hypothetical protein